jgi:predicted tellurium resistance membrane protein TerC
MMNLMDLRLGVLGLAAAFAIYGALIGRPRSVDYACLTLLLMVCAMILRQFA